MTRTPSSKDHHHGDLKNALIDAGVSLLEEGGTAALSLRKCAARAGVSHAAPAHHFDGLSGLKYAIAQRAFETFSQTMAAARDAGPQTPEGRLLSICQGYLSFGLEHPGLLAIIFGHEGSLLFNGSERHDDYSAYMILRDACAPFVTQTCPAEVLELHVWSLCHGFTMLAVGGKFGDIGGDAPIEAIADMVFRQLSPLLRPPKT